jgi:hypothetical protein
MVGPYSFGALRQTYGPLFVRCDVCGRYARLYLVEIRDTDSRTRPLAAAGVAAMVLLQSRSRARKPA